MSKKAARVENRVYVFTPLATEFVRTAGPETLADPRRLRAALAELARAACLMSDEPLEEADALARQIIG